MSNLEKIQKGIKVLQILSKIILVFTCVGVALASIGAALVASDVLNMEKLQPRGEYYHIPWNKCSGEC